MIKFNLFCHSKHWPARANKINKIIENILNHKNDLDFNKNINYNCNFILTDNKLIKQMNKKFLNKKKPTDVLTFASELNIKNKKKQKICDIFLSAEIIFKDARTNGVSFYNHLTHLFIHSFLHINGYNHNQLIDFNKMKKIEIKVLNKVGVSDPYI
jgi:probable rRNA maturation factor